MKDNFNSLLSIATFIENNKELLNNISELLDKNETNSNNLYENLEKMTLKISELSDNIEHKNFFGFINNEENYPIIWDSSSNSNILCNLVNPLENIKKYLLNITNNHILNIKESYIENSSNNNLNPSIIFPIFSDNDNNNIKFFIFVHSWINKSELINTEIYNKLILNDILKTDNVTNLTRESIRNNLPIEDKLNVIIVLSNPCNYRKRVKLAKEFIERMKFEKYVELYIVELAYDCNPQYYITEHNNPHHLQLKTKTPLWHKENMINLGVLNLLPKDWKAFAWIDADVEFENESWALDTLKILNGNKNIIQLFSHAVDMSNQRTAMEIVTSAGYKYEKKEIHIPYKCINYWHPGYAWACTRDVFESMKGLWQYNILGGGDMVMCKNAIHFSLDNEMYSYSNDYKKYIYNFQKSSNYLNFGYCPGVIRHNYHGSKINRKYMERADITFKHKYSPSKHITFDNIGILIPTSEFSDEFKKDIYTYFEQRNEDE